MVLASEDPAKRLLTEANAATRYTSRAIVSSAADPVAHLSQLAPFAQFEARPAGTLLWPQAFSINEAEQELYVGQSGPLTTGGPNTLRLSVRTMDGSIKSQKDIPIAEATSSEGLPWFKNGAGDLCFIVRPAASGVGYAIYNYTTGTMGPTIAITGNYKSDVEGSIFATCDAHTSTGGVGNVYLYDWESVKAGTPTLLSTVKLESRNFMNKVQSFAVNGGALIFSHGASKTEPYVSAYTLTGKLITAFQFDKPVFADAINAGFPGTITDRANYRHESEGAYSYKGHLLTGHITDNNTSAYTFTIVRHNAVDGLFVPQIPQVMAHDTGWQPLWTAERPAPAGLSAYIAGQEPQYRKIGDAFYNRGWIKGLPTSPSRVVIGTYPFAPAIAMSAVQMTSSSKTANWQLNTNGTIEVYNSGNPGDATSWYPLPTGPFFTA